MFSAGDKGLFSVKAMVSALLSACLLHSAVLAIPVGNHVPATEHNGSKDYAGYQLIRVVPATSDHLTLLKWLHTSTTSANHTLIDMWLEPTVVSRPVDLLLAPEVQDYVHGILTAGKLTPSVAIADMGRMMRDEHARQEPLRDTAMAAGKFDYNDYHSHEDILAHMHHLVQQHPDFVQYGSIGRSYEGRELAYLRIGYPAAGGSAKPALFVDAGIHAREWIAPATALHLIGRLIADAELRPLLQRIDVYVLPSLNPDGYEYSRRVERFWRKTRSPPRARQGVRQQVGGECYGVDPNRNFPEHWDFSGTSSETCAEIYSGPHALSEVECAALAGFLQQQSGSIKAYLSFHSYGNLLLHSWGYAVQAYPDDVADQVRVGNAMAEAVRKAGGPTFTVGSTADVLYEASGSSQDYAKSVGIKYAYTMELTYTNFGFAYPARLIKDISPQAVEGLLVLAKEVALVGEASAVKTEEKLTGNSIVEG